MKKAQVEARARSIRKKEAEKLACIEKATPPNTLLPNTGGEEFVSRLYRANRTFLVRVPRSVVQELGIQPGMLVRLKILQEEL